MVTETITKEVAVNIRWAHPEQRRFIDSQAKHKVIRAGRRGGKTVGIAILAVRMFLSGKRVLYTAPTSEQTDAFWFELKQSLMPLVDTGVYKLNETERYIEKVGTKNRIKAKTAWAADSLRGDYGDLLIFDEYQLTNEDAWEVVGMPMLLDNNGDVVFIYTPPSLRSAGVSKARDPRHAAKLYKKAQADTSGRWETFHFTSYDNPFISREALGELTKDMSQQTRRQEIMAEDDEIELSWLVYKAFNEAICKIPRFEIPKNWLVYTGHDFGPANPGALFFAQVKLPLPVGAPPYMRLNDLVCFKEYLPGGMGAPQHVNAFREICSQWILENKDWHPARSIGGNVTTEDQTRQLYGMHGWTISAPTITRVNAQIDRVVGLMELNKIYCFEDNYNWIGELMNCLWEQDNEGKPTNKVRDEQKYHLSACARTLLSDFTPETVGTNQGYRTTTPQRKLVRR